MIYLDYAATTPINQDVYNSYCKLLENYFANSASIHKMGLKANEFLEASRESISNLIKVKKELLSSIREKEVQLSKLKEHINKSEVCSDLYNKILIEKAILKQQLDDLQNKSLISRIKHLLPRQEKLICDYFHR